MDILIVAATEHEIAITRRYLSEKIYQRRDCNVHILITGASQGLGLAVAEVFAKKGNTLLLSSKNDRKL